MRLPQFGKKLFDRAPARTADDVADKQNFHRKNLTAKHTKYTKENGFQPETRAENHAMREPACVGQASRLSPSKIFSSSW
jgi:hypothetical protein